MHHFIIVFLDVIILRADWPACCHSYVNKRVASPVACCDPTLLYEGPVEVDITLVLQTNSVIR